MPRSLSPQLRIHGQRLPPTACQSPWPLRDARHSPASPEPAQPHFAAPNLQDAAHVPPAFFETLPRLPAQYRAGLVLLLALPSLVLPSQKVRELPCAEYSLASEDYATKVVG